MQYKSFIAGDALVVVLQELNLLTSIVTGVTVSGIWKNHILNLFHRTKTNYHHFDSNEVNLEKTISKAVL